MPEGSVLIKMVSMERTPMQIAPGIRPKVACRELPVFAVLLEGTSDFCFESLLADWMRPTHNIESNFHLKSTDYRC